MAASPCGIHLARTGRLARASAQLLMHVFHIGFGGQLFKSIEFVIYFSEAKPVLDQMRAEIKRLDAELSELRADLTIARAGVKGGIVEIGRKSSRDEA